MHVIKEDFFLHKARQGKQQVKNIKPNLILNIMNLFKNLKNCKEFDVLKSLDVIK